MTRHKPRMTAEQAFKKRFVERKLSPALEEATDGFVVRCEYTAWRDDETVELHLDDISRALGRKVGNPADAECRKLKVDVSLDSKWAIVKDVMRALAREYE